MSEEKKSFLNQKTIGVAGVIVAIVSVLVVILLNQGPEPDFSISVNPIEISVQQGGKIPVSVNVIALNNYKHPIYLSATSENSEIASSFSIQSMKAAPSFSSIMTIDVNSNVEPQTYTLIIKGIGADGKEKNCNLILNVSPAPNFDPTPATALFYPSGFMGDIGDIILNDNFTNTVHTGRSCIQIQYSAKMSHNKGWSGIYWQYPDKNWGDSPDARDLTGATRITFWARGQKGGERVEFKTGGINGKYKDSMGGPYSTGVLNLSTGWEQFTINLKGKDLSHVIGGFCWVASSALNPKGCIIYIDDIIFE
ncbi:MAG: hypothetical protein GF353_26860 [Candidatus Lokiarchaeota archaeon]|nr:hypothetical protein [Candidatus Lokiarchaeota archaeon]